MKRLIVLFFVITLMLTACAASVPVEPTAAPADSSAPVESASPATEAPVPETTSALSEPAATSGPTESAAPATAAPAATSAPSADAPLPALKTELGFAEDYSIEAQRPVNLKLALRQFGPNAEGFAVPNYIIVPLAEHSKVPVQYAQDAEYNLYILAYNPGYRFELGMFDSYMQEYTILIPPRIMDSLNIYSISFYDNGDLRLDRYDMEKEGHGNKYWYRFNPAAGALTFEGASYDPWTGKTGEFADQYNAEERAALAALLAGE